MGQAPTRETMTQGEIDILLRHIESGEAALGPIPPDSVELAKKIVRNYRQLEYALKRCATHDLANVGPEERAARLAQARHYARWNWLLKRGFVSRKDFRAFMDREAARKGMALIWGGKQ